IRGVAGSGGFDAIARFGVAGGGFDLDTKKAMAEVDDRVVALAVSPRETDSEAEASGAGEEGGFGGLSATLTRGLGGGMEFDDLLDLFPVRRAGLFPSRKFIFCWCGFARIVPHNRKGAAVGCASMLPLTGI